MRTERREKEKNEKLEQLYKEHDEKASQIKDITFAVTEAEKNEMSDNSELEGMTTDGEEAQKRRAM